MDDLPPVVASPSLARRQALREADQAHQIRVTDSYPLTKYMLIAQKLFGFFQDSYEQLNLDEAFVYGVRLVHLGLTHLPKHKEWKVGGKDEEYLRLQIGKVLSKLDFIKRRMDEEETAKMRARNLARSQGGVRVQNSLHQQQQRLSGNGGTVTPGDRHKVTKKAKRKWKKIFGIPTSNKGAAPSIPTIAAASGGNGPLKPLDASTIYTIESLPAVEEKTLRLQSAQTQSLLDLRYAPESDNTHHERLKEGKQAIEICREKDTEKEISAAVITPVSVAKASISLASGNSSSSSSYPNPSEIPYNINQNNGMGERPGEKEETMKSETHQEKGVSSTIAPHKADEGTTSENRDEFGAKSNPVAAILQNSAAEMFPSKVDVDAASEHTNAYSNVKTPPKAKDYLLPNYSKANLLDPYDDVVNELEEKMRKMYTGHHVVVESNGTDVNHPDMDNNIDINNFFDIFEGIISDTFLSEKAFANKGRRSFTEFTVVEEETKESTTKTKNHEINVCNIFAAFDSILSKIEGERTNDVLQEIAVKDDLASQEKCLDHVTEEEALLDNGEADFQHNELEVESIQCSQSNDNPKPVDGSIANSLRNEVSINDFFAVFDDILSKTESTDGKEKTYPELKDESNIGSSHEMVVQGETAGHSCVINEATVVEDDESYFEYTVVDPQSTRSIQTSRLAKPENCSNTNDSYDEIMLDDESYFEYTIAEPQSTRKLETSQSNINRGDSYEEHTVLDDESYFEFTIAEPQSTRNLQTSQLAKQGNGLPAFSTKHGTRRNENSNDGASQAIMEEEDSKEEESAVEYIEDETIDESIYVEDTVEKDQSIQILQTTELVKPENGPTTKSTNKAIDSNSTLKGKESHAEYTSVEDFINDRLSREIATKKAADYEKEICRNFNDREDILWGGEPDMEYTVAEVKSLQSIALSRSENKSKHHDEILVSIGTPENRSKQRVTKPSFEQVPRIQPKQSLQKITSVKVHKFLDNDDDMTVITMDPCLEAIDNDLQLEEDSMPRKKFETDGQDKSPIRPMRLKSINEQVDERDKPPMRPMRLESINEQSTSENRSNHLDSIPEDNFNNKSSTSKESLYARVSQFKPILRKITSVRVNKLIDDDDLTCITMDSCLHAIDDDPKLEEKFKDRIIEITRKDLWKRDIKVIENAVMDLNGFAHFYQSGCSTLVAEYGGIAGIAAVMTRFPDHEVIQFFCCDTLGKIVPCEPKLLEMVIENEIVALISRSMSRHPNSQLIQDAGRATIADLSYQGR